VVIWSDPAKADLRSIHDFIAHNSTHYAKKVTQDIVAKTDGFDELPRMGKVVPELGNEDIASWRSTPTASSTKSRHPMSSCWR